MSGDFLVGDDFGDPATASRARPPGESASSVDSSRGLSSSVPSSSEKEPILSGARRLRRRLLTTGSTAAAPRCAVSQRTAAMHGAAADKAARRRGSFWLPSRVPSCVRRSIADNRLKSRPRRPLRAAKAKARDDAPVTLASKSTASASTSRCKAAACAPAVASRGGSSDGAASSPRGPASVRCPARRMAAASSEACCQTSSFAKSTESRTRPRCICVSMDETRAAETTAQVSSPQDSTDSRAAPSTSPCCAASIARAFPSSSAAAAGPSAARIRRAPACTTPLDRGRREKRRVTTILAIARASPAGSESIVFAASASVATASAFPLAQSAHASNAAAARASSPHATAKKSASLQKAGSRDSFARQRPSTHRAAEARASEVPPEPSDGASSQGGEPAVRSDGSKWAHGSWTGRRASSTPVSAPRQRSSQEKRKRWTPTSVEKASHLRSEDVAQSPSAENNAAFDASASAQKASPRAVQSEASKAILSSRVAKGPHPPSKAASTKTHMAHASSNEPHSKARMPRPRLWRQASKSSGPPTAQKSCCSSESPRNTAANAKSRDPTAPGPLLRAKMRAACSRSSSFSSQSCATSGKSAAAPPNCRSESAAASQAQATVAPRRT
mmetsp:Transcript_27212/g.97244  ORF Transcript_27212/g.97244 Transcript_27212/m.97244 type:complete len:618 (+) Transcript_27212:4662-6515(+)